MSYPFAQQVDWITRTASGRDTYGDDVYTEVSTTISAVFAPGGSGEITQGGDVVTTQPTLYGIAPGTAVKSNDRFVIDGATYEVDGDPQSYASPFTGWDPGIVVPLRRVTGAR